MADGAVRESIVRWGDLAWRLVAIGVVVYFGFTLLRTVSVVVLAVVFAMFGVAVLWKPSRWLIDHGWSNGLASAACLLVAALVVSGLLLFIVPQVVSSFESMGQDLAHTWDSIQDWLINGPLGLSQADIDSYVGQISDWAQSVGSRSVVGGATAVVEFLTGAVLAIVITFFLLKDGRRLLDMVLARTPDRSADRLATAVRVGRETLAQYIGGIALVGLFDATLIGIVLWIVGAPLVIPLALLVFLGAYVPLIGAFISGLLAVAVTFVNIGFTHALIVLAAVILVQQFEGHVFMPLVYGSALRLHPLVVLLGVTAGGLAFGLIGAFLAVPLIALAESVHEAISDDPEASYVSLARG